MTRYTILFVIPHLAGGGAAKVCLQLARAMPEERFQTHMAVLTDAQRAFECGPAGVPVHRLHAGRVLTSAAALVRLARDLKPHLIFSSMFHVNFLVLLLRPFLPQHCRIVVRQNGVPGRGLSWSRRLPARILFHLLYRRADAVICQTEGMAEHVRTWSGGAANICILANPVDTATIRSSIANTTSPTASQAPLLLAVGRLAPEKGFRLLLEAFATLRAEYPRAQLTILGEGPERRALEVEADRLRLGPAVQLAGQNPDVSSWLARATLLVLSSHHEGLPNVLLEAAAAGLPIVATPAEGGLSDLLREKQGVWLAECCSAESLASALARALQELQPKQRFAHSWIDEFDLPQAVGAYQDLLLRQLEGVPS